MRKRPIVVLFTGIFLELFLEYFHTVTAMTQDLGRHLLTGKIILQTQSVPNVNLFSYTVSQFPFINHHWLSEVIFYVINYATGLNGLLVFSVSIVFMAFSIVFFYGYKETKNVSPVLVSLLFIPLLLERTDIRPEIFSYFFVGIFSVLLFSYRKRFTKLIFLLIPMQLLWANMHIYFIIGILLVGLFLSEAIILKRKILFQYSRNLITHHTDSSIDLFQVKQIFVLFLVLLGCFFMTFFNPGGVKGAIYPFTFFQNYGYAIEENQNILFLQSHYPRASIIYFEIALVCMLITFIVSNKKTRLIDWFLFVVFSLLGVMAVRNFSLFVFGLFTPFAYTLSPIIHLIQKQLQNKKAISIGLFCLCLLVMALQISHILTTRTFGFGEVTGASKALDFFIRNKLKGPIFNNFDIGSYIEYRLYPKERVFVDGRPEAYPVKFFSDVYIPMQREKDMFQKIDSLYHFNIIIFSYTDLTPWSNQFIQQIGNNNQWVIIYLDDTIVMLVKKTKQNEAIVNTYAMTQDTVHLDNIPENNPESLNRLAYFFNTFGWDKQEEVVLKKLLAIDENNCSSLYNLSVLYYKENNPAKDIFGRKTLTLCPQYSNQHSLPE